MPWPGTRRNLAAGLLTLPAALILLALASLAILSAARPLVVEMRSSTAHHRTVRALQTAEAGQAWALAALNAPGSESALCGGGTAVLWRDQVLHAPLLQASTASEAIGAQDILTSCERTSDPWQCRCSARSATGAPPPDEPAESPSPDRSRFHLSWTPGPTAWTASLLSQACDGESCTDSGSSPLLGGRGAVRQSFTQLGAWRQALPAVLTAGQRLSLAAGTHISLSQPAEAAALTPRWALAAGQGLSAPPDGLTGPPGTPIELLMQPGVPNLPATLDATLRALVGLPLAWWSRLPTVERIPCPRTGCTRDDLLPALAEGRPGIAVLGDLRLQTTDTLAIGADGPVMLVVQGRVDMAGPIHLHGVLIAQEINGSGPGPSSLRGAAWSAGNLSLDAPIEVTHAPDSLATLARLTPAWIPVAGTWEDLTDE